MVLALQHFRKSEFARYDLPPILAQSFLRNGSSSGKPDSGLFKQLASAGSDKGGICIRAMNNGNVFVLLTKRTARKSEVTSKEPKLRAAHDQQDFV